MTRTQKRKTTKRPSFIVNWRDVLDKKAGRYPDSDEEHGIDAPFDKHAGFSRIGVHFEVLKPGRRTSYPHAERDEEEFVYVVAGEVDCWLDGHLHAMRAGDFVGFVDRTGVAHVIINNSKEDAHLIVGGEASRQRSKVHYPLNPAQNRVFVAKGAHWSDCPKRELGSHDGLPDALRKQREKEKKASKK